MRKLSTFISCQFLLFFLNNAAIGQDNYFIQHYTNENGLPANGVKGIELDKKSGFLWIGTQAGLVRFDGKNFKHFGSAKTTAIPSRIAFISKNREGTIYCEENNFSVYRIADNKAEWVATDSFLMARLMMRDGKNPSPYLKEMTEKLLNAERSAFLPPWIVFHERLNDSSSFSVLYFDQIYYYNAAKDTLFNFPDFQSILKLNGHVYYARPNMELWEYNDRLNSLLPVQVAGMPAWNENGEKPRFIWVPGMKNPLFIYKQDIWKVQEAENGLSLIPLCQECSPANAEISCIQIWEEKGLIFLGSPINGLYVARVPFLHSVRADISTETGKAEYAQVEAAPGIINTASGLVYSAEGKLLPGKKPLHKFQTNSIYQNQEGDCWYSSGDTIIHFYRQGNYYAKIAMNNNAAQMVFAETGKRVYVISDRAIAEITGDRYRQLYKLPYLPDALRNSLSPTAVVEWKPGVLAIAAEKLLFFDTKKETAPDSVPIPGLIAQVRSLLKYGDYLLIGTYGQGFYMYKDGKVKKMPPDKNGYLSYAHCFMPDDNGYCWISTNRGLFKASLNALVKAYENNLNEIYYQYFGQGDGIFNTEFNGGCQPCGIKLSNGLFSFPSMNGVVIFDPLQQHTSPPSGQLFIDEVWVDSSLFRIDDHSLQELPYKLKNLRFKIALSQFVNEENIYFSYKLEPYNDEWETQDITQNSTLQFGGLKPGNYTLYLRIRNGFEPDQFGTTEIRFRISKPWYQTWLFYLLCLLSLIAVIWGLVKWRTARIARRKKELQQQVAMQTKNIEEQSKQLESQLMQLQSQQIRLEEDNQIKSRLIGIISHDMISPLKFMGHMSKKMKDYFPESDAHHHTAGFIASVAEELESLSVNILNWIKFHHASAKMKPETFNVYELTTASVEIASTLAKEKGIILYNDVSPKLEAFHYRQAIGVIIYNLVMNATKYTNTGEIRITSYNTEHHLLLTVADTGMGMPAELVVKLNSPEPFVAGYSISETSKYQFGYIIIKDLLRLIHGSMLVESVPGKGTKVTIELRFPES